jgi:hypothetical protein
LTGCDKPEEGKGAFFIADMKTPLFPLSRTNPVRAEAGPLMIPFRSHRPILTTPSANLV